MQAAAVTATCHMMYFMQPPLPLPLTPEGTTETQVGEFFFKYTVCVCMHQFAAACHMVCFMQNPPPLPPYGRI